MAATTYFYGLLKLQEKSYPMKPVNRYLWRLFLLTTFIKLWFLILLSFITTFSFSQTTNISGTVNSYHSVLGVSSTAAKLDNVSGLGYGNTVLLIQMKGAGINTANNSHLAIPPL